MSSIAVPHANDVACPACGVAAGVQCIGAFRHYERIKAAVVVTREANASERRAMDTRCCCGFIAPNGVLPSSSRWHAAHKRQHLERYPNVDALTIENLDMLITLAARRELLAAEACS